VYTKSLEPVAKVSEKPKAAPRTVVRHGYPIRGNWWTGCGGWQHLTQGEHAGKFDANWLRSLSNAEIQSIHSDDHEGRLKRQYIVRPGQCTTL
jgi:hypothetical protein